MMGMSLEGRVALVSGGGRGIGRGIAEALAREGADIAINYRRDEEAAREAAEQLRGGGRRAEMYQADVSDWGACEAMVAAVLRDFGKVDILVNNAGIASRGQTVGDTDPAEMERVVRTHAFSAFYLSKLVLPSMREQPRGDIIMISSGATRTFAGNGAPYNMGKAALEALAKTLAKEERGNNIRVNVVAPGLVETEMGRRLARATMGAQNLRDVDAVSPFGFVCQPEDIGNAVAFLCSEAGRYITNDVIYVDGGGFQSAPARPRVRA
jgi:NAD(P)-dependent dehydrogenase (short-subunit alcohol dehydrogenase family)